MAEKLIKNQQVTVKILLPRLSPRLSGFSIKMAQLAGRGTVEIFRSNSPGAATIFGHLHSELNIDCLTSEALYAKPWKQLV